MKRFEVADLNHSALMSRDEVRAFDAWAINELGVPGVILMENAGRGCTEIIIEKLSRITGRNVCIFCGTGNNGGDGYVIARHLYNEGFLVHVVICGKKEKVKGDALINLKIIDGMDISIKELLPSGANVADKVAQVCAENDLIVDALFGTGLTGRLRKDYVELVQAINSADKPIVAVDIPSGLDCDTGRVLGAAVKAATTVTFVAVKKGFKSLEAARYTGEVYVASIGIEPANYPRG